MTTGSATDDPRSRLVIDLTMLALAVGSLGLVLYEITAEADITQSQQILLDAVDLVIVLIFVGEFVWSARASGAPWDYVRRNWYDLPSMVWLPGSILSGLVSLRLLRFVRLVRILRTASRLRRIGRQFEGRRVLQERVLYIALIAVSIILFGALSAFVLEEGTNPQFRSLWDALWWAIVTTATVGYGDMVPVTSGGRTVAVLLMTVGVGIIGAFAGTMAQVLFTRKEESAKRRIHSRWHKLAAIRGER